MNIDTIARDISATLHLQQPLQPLVGRVPGFDVATAYDVARHLRLQRQADGRRLLGRKIGFTNRSIWPVYGVFQPIWGAMYDDTVHALPAGRGRLSLRGLYEPRIEPELVLHLGSVPQPGESPARLLARVDQVAHAFEIVQSPFPGWRFGAADAVAVGSLHRALCLGPAVATAALAADPLAALSGFAITLRCDGVDRDQGRGANVLDGPLHALAHLVQVLADRPADEQLQAGEWISTGTLTAALPVAAGQRWQTQLEGIALPGLDLTFED